MSIIVFRAFSRSLCTSHISPTPNRAVNADAPVRVFNSAGRRGGAPVTYIR